MGPVPGLLLALALTPFLASFAVTDPTLFSSAIFLFWLVIGLLNGLNLLPFIPFDSGKVVESTLFCRSPFAKAWFYLISAASLIVFGLLAEFYTLLVIGLLLALLLPHVFKTARIVSEIKKEGGGMPKINVPANELSDDDLLQILKRLKGFCKTPKEYAAMTEDIIRQSQEPPSIKATVALLSVYVFSFFIVLYLLFVYLFHSNRYGL